MNPIDKLTALFEKFPGIGPRQARRFVAYLLAAPPALRKDIARHIHELGAQTVQCRLCRRWSVRAENAKTLCDTCASPKRDCSTLFIVEKDADIESVERSGYRGLYFVLGGTIPLAADTPEKHVRLKELLERVKEMELKEIIFGLSATTEGDHTRLILQEQLRDSGKKISSLGRGLSTGSELEYADPDTISQALTNRC